MLSLPVHAKQVLYSWAPPLGLRSISDEWHIWWVAVIITRTACWALTSRAARYHFTYFPLTSTACLRRWHHYSPVFFFPKAKQQGGLKGWVTDSGCSRFTLTTSRRNADWLQEKEPAEEGMRSPKSRNDTEMPCLKGNSPSLSFELKKMSKPSIYLKTSCRLRRHSDWDATV